VGPVVSAGCAVSWDAVARDVGAALVYITMDMWESRAAHEEFRETHATEYAQLDETGLPYFLLFGRS